MPCPRGGYANLLFWYFKDIVFQLYILHFWLARIQCYGATEVKYLYSRAKTFKQTNLLFITIVINNMALPPWTRPISSEAWSGLVGTWLGDRLGIPGGVGW